ncbi:MAG: zf-HC2 domain-containing protein [Chloracidobacterium sp.]|uniref:Zf-HC2 domain-containing protein n=1 Tax=Chloracidobacterium validum TaxID=2821543 RepID=A0ABX8BG38_9BACT|nr:zf-HC2 domain-containing protein [Chloracidobacterium validum]QUW04619.1 zf-HC2 domain-containing protein [Chloracidobacterium validum]
MECERCLEQLDGYLDGELDARSVTSLEAHLQQCPACSAECRARRWEQRVYRDAVAGVTLPDTIWPRVAANIARADARQAPRTAPRWGLPSGWWALGLAMGCAVVAFGLWSLWRPPATTEPLLVRQNAAATEKTAPPLIGGAPAVSENTTPSDAVIIEPPRRRTVPTAPPAPRQLSEAERALQQAEQAYVVVIERLQSQVRSRQSQLDVSTRTALEQTLSELDAKIAQTREVVRQSPADPAAMHFLMTAYRKKAEVLSEVVVITQN